MVVEERGIDFRTGVRLPSGPCIKKSRNSVISLFYAGFSDFPYAEIFAYKRIKVHKFGTYATRNATR